jgi:hypothetical protein
MNRLALDTAPIGRPDEGPPQDEWAPREAQTSAMLAGSENRWELRRSALPKPGRGFKSNPSP